MGTSGTRTFNLDFDEIYTQAVAIAGGEPADGSTVRLAKRAFNLMTMDWSNRGLNLWQLDQAVIPIVAGQAAYVLDEDVLDVLDVSFRDDSTGRDLDTLLGRISWSDYAGLVDKAQVGRPSTYYVQRLYTGPVLTIWPVPDANDAKELFVWRIRRTEDQGTFGQDAAVPSRFLPAAVTGLAYHIAQTRPASVDGARRGEIKAAYEADLARAMADDRERTPTYVMPDLSAYWRPRW